MESMYNQKKLKKVIKKMHKMQESASKAYKLALKREKSAIDVLKRQLGKEMFLKLKNVCTDTVPEVKDENGNVTKNASSSVNWEMFKREARLVIAAAREDRIRSGKRKKSSGSTSQKQNHTSAMKFIELRNEVLKELQSNSTSTKDDGGPNGDGKE